MKHIVIIKKKPIPKTDIGLFFTLKPLDFCYILINFLYLILFNFFHAPIFQILRTFSRNKGEFLFAKSSESKVLKLKLKKKLNYSQISINY